MAAAEVSQQGHGGVKAIADAAGLSRRTVERAMHELRSKSAACPDGRLRRPGGGRKALSVCTPGLVQALEELVDPMTRGDPMSPLRWTSKSTAKLAKELNARGHVVSARSVAKLASWKSSRLVLSPFALLFIVLKTSISSRSERPR